eukprot:CAMPEP_0118709074 /NCGR_PEP_ID=MMETSP0800-20121206/22370_1 /TAXON_ID=210618 ORGANISM="Striatella unipunctata, Strain CCMP2910" /NCGR_SAMPLE_ID=MMETSP0800 /ASSEMBLY_ACC=CAM_ASM_000638 /LENGTH=94 /DNA_ID=CAMNT_0006612597 /DNA_START=72 /DNA_END=353 /DNA_ORIENTATION=+
MAPLLSSPTATATTIAKDPVQTIIGGTTKPTTREEEANGQWDDDSLSKNNALQPSPLLPLQRQEEEEAEVSYCAEEGPWTGIQIALAVYIIVVT